MASTDLVSVVIPTHYRNDTLGKCIESVLRQNHEPIEIIVVDDSGEGHAAPVIEGYDLQYIELEENHGAQIARSIGIQEASGEYLQLLDDDDLLNEQKIESEKRVMDEDDVGVVYCGMEWKTGDKILPDSEVQGDVLRHALMFQMAPCVTSTMLIDMDVMRELLPLSDKFGGADDVRKKIELAKRTEFAYVSEALVDRIHTEESLGGTKSSYEGRFQILNEYKDLYDDYPSDVRATALANAYLHKAEYELDSQIWSIEAIKSAIRMTYYNPNMLYIGYILASLFGRPGRDIARDIYSKWIRSSTTTGKVGG